MKNNLYVFYNKLSHRYGDVICSPSDDYVAHQIDLMFQNPQCVVRREETELCRVGTIDIETGVVIAADAPIRIDIPNSFQTNVDSMCTPSDQ